MPRGEPDPAIYEFTLRQLNAHLPRPPLLRASECLVIEDSRAGVLAGLKAGMRVLAVATTYSASQLSDAHLVLPNLEGVTPAELAHRLFQKTQRMDVAGRLGTNHIGQAGTSRSEFGNRRLARRRFKKAVQQSRSEPRVEAYAPVG